MECCAGRSGVCPLPGELQVTIKPVLDFEYKDTLLGSFVEDGCLDELRQLAAELGARPYRVFLVQTIWSGARRGQGVERIKTEVEILPTPKVDPMTGINLQLQAVGLDEVGGLQITEIPPRYQENALRGLGPNGEALAPNEEFFWEVSLSRGDSESKRRRRFQIQGVPSYHAADGGALQWHVRLLRAGTDREADGSSG